MTPTTMRVGARHPDPTAEYFTPERCWILELSNVADDPFVSIARARVEPGVTTRRHRVRNTVERYVVLDGVGSVEVGDRPAEQVGPGDVIHIPAGAPQRIANVGATDLVFLAICTPRFEQSAYEEMDGEA